MLGDFIKYISAGSVTTSTSDSRAVGCYASSDGFIYIVVEEKVNSTDSSALIAMEPIDDKEEPPDRVEPVVFERTLEPLRELRTQPKPRPLQPSSTYG